MAVRGACSFICAPLASEVGSASGLPSRSLGGGLGTFLKGTGHAISIAIDRRSFVLHRRFAGSGCVPERVCHADVGYDARLFGKGDRSLPPDGRVATGIALSAPSRPSLSFRSAGEGAATREEGQLTRSVLPIAVLLSLLPAGCVTQGVGTAQGVSAPLGATLNWRATGANQGTMRATLSDGRVYDGQFFQITQQTEIDSIQPLWNGWDDYRHSTGSMHWNASPQFLTHYSGKVLANLQGAGGAMRCRFILRQPSGGMTGGGQGRCQLSDGTRFRAQLPAH